MNFRDRGIIIAKKPLKEKTSIVTIFTEKHGLYSGVITQYSKKSGDSLSEGNLVEFFWSARLHEHIGSANCELIKSYGSNIVMNKTKLYAFNSIVSIIKKAFHEREPHNNFFPILLNFMEQMTEEFSFKNYIKLELEILAESGYKLQLNSCTVTGSCENLYYVSPKSGCAVSKEAGTPYADKLLILPKFLSIGGEIDNQQKTQAIKLTSYFLNRYIFHNNQQPEAKNRLIEHLLGA